MKYTYSLIFVLCSVLLSAQDRDVEIRVHKGPVISLLPDTDIISDKVPTTFVVTGMSPGSTLRASVSRGLLEIHDSTLTITTALNLPPWDSLVKPMTIILRVKTFGRNSEAISSLEKTFAVMPASGQANIYIPSLPPPQSRRVNSISFRGFRVITWKYREGNLAKKTLSPANERMIRNNVGSSFGYHDSTTTSGLWRSYRAVDMVIEIGGRQVSYHANGSNISMVMSEELRKQHGKANFTLLLHKPYPRGDRSKDVIDTISYTVPQGRPFEFLQKKAKTVP